MAIFDYKCSFVNTGVSMTAFEVVDRGRRIQRGTTVFPGDLLPVIQGDIADELETNPSLQ